MLRGEGDLHTEFMLSIVKIGPNFGFDGLPFMCDGPPFVN